MVFWVAQGFAVASFVINVIGMQFNDRKKIILSVVFGGITSVASLWLLGAISGSWMQIVFTVQAIINYCLIKQKKEIPFWLSIIYILMAFICSSITYVEPLDVFPLIATILHTLVILQKKERSMRFINVGSVICWIPYYIVYKSYGTLATACVVLISTLLAIYRYDVRREK